MFAGVCTFVPFIVQHGLLDRLYAPLLQTAERPLKAPSMHASMYLSHARPAVTADKQQTNSKQYRQSLLVFATVRIVSGLLEEGQVGFDLVLRTSFSPL